MMSINNPNHLLPNKASNLSTMMGETYTPGKRKDAPGSKFQQYKNYATLSINDCNDMLSTTTDKRTTDERVENSYRNLKNKTFAHTETHRDVQERKALLQIEERLEREYKFYQVKTNAKDQHQEKVPEMLLREAADETIKKLAKMATQYSSVLNKIRDCYNNCIKTAIADSEGKSKKIKDIKKELSEVNKKEKEFEKALEIKDKALQEANKEISKLKKSKKEVDRRYEELEEYTNEVKKKSDQFLGKYDQQKVLKEIKDLIKENEDIKCIARELKSEIEYGKQRENKLMYFLFLMQQKNYPVFEIFEDNIKDLPTSRFSTNLDDKFKEIYIEQKKKMKSLGLIGDYDIACSERAHKMRKLDQETEISFMTEESYEPINSGPAPRLNKPKIVPALNFNKMKENLDSEKKKAERLKRDKKYANSNPGRRANSQDNSSALPDMLEDINHNKYAQQQKYQEEAKYVIDQQDQQLLEDQNKYAYEEYDDGESSPCSCSYCLRKEQGKGGIEELLAMNNVENDDSKTHSFHSSILHENRGKYKNIKELRRLYEVMKSYDEP